MKTLSLLLIATTSCLTICSSCKKLISVKQQATDPNIIFDFKNDSEANAAIVGIYEQMSAATTSFATGRQSISLLAGLSADELNCYSTDDKYIQFYANELSASNTEIFSLWQSIYKCIYQCNGILDALQNNNNITQTFCRQLQGEALFFRGFLNFYLVNLYGRVPLPLGTNFAINNTLHQKSPQDVYSQIVRDLDSAGTMLPNAYILSGERIRVNSVGAKALLSRVYLYTKQYASCADAATQVISQHDKYQLCSQLDQTFLKNSQEAILQLQPVVPGYNTWDAAAFILPVSPFLVAMNRDLVNQFDSKDLRLSHWIGHINIGSSVYYFAFKYQHHFGEPLQDYLMLLRLAEQYLNRAEAYAWQGNLDQSLQDLEVIRSRAGLNPLPPMGQDQLLAAIWEERRKELFTEWGHRWLDLKRTGAIDSVLSKAKPGWKSYFQLYPIPASELLVNPNLIQNTGY